jgi:hypothetical protein
VFLHGCEVSSSGSPAAFRKAFTSAAYTRDHLRLLMRYHSLQHGIGYATPVAASGFKGNTRTISLVISDSDR